MFIPDAAAMEYLGPYIDDVYEMQDLECPPEVVLTAIHEAAHHLLRAVFDLIGGDLQMFSDHEGKSHPPFVGAVIDDPRAGSIMSLAGGVAEGELAARLVESPMRGWIGSLHAQPDIAQVHPFAWPCACEADALMLIRVHWVPLLRLARALLDSPTRCLTWDEALAVIGPGVVGSGFDTITEQLYREVWDGYVSGDIGSVRDEWWAEERARAATRATD